jgi:hypothetical protein
LFSLTKIAQKLHLPPAKFPSPSPVAVKSITVFTSKFLVVIELHANPNQWNRRGCSYGT